MTNATKIFSRDCKISDSAGTIAPLAVAFYAPVKSPGGDDYLARANISCSFFDKDVYGTGEDAAQAFFALPWAVVSYLIGQRRYGYEAYWLERGDLNYSNFWLYQK